MTFLQAKVTRDLAVALKALRESKQFQSAADPHTRFDRRLRDQAQKRGEQ